MATRTMTYFLCDGCFRDTLHDGIGIAQTRTRWPEIADDQQTLDICAECFDQERYICRSCRRVHGDDNPCEAQLKEIE